MKVYPLPPLHFVEREMNTKLGEGNFIFVGSSTDGWAVEVLADWILATLRHCCMYPHNRYLFQSKIPSRFPLYLEFMPPDFILGTTIETNRDYEVSQAPTAEARMLSMISLPYPKMVSIEPIMDFDLDILTDWVKEIHPLFVSIGADSKGHNLPEPSPEKLKALIENLKNITTVKLKDNLKRLVG